jgi:putative ABC transport system ATP-binding protein
MALIEVVNAWRRYGNGNAAVAAVAGATMTVRRGEFVAIEGPSGSGKTTMLGLLAALEAPDEGTVRVLGLDLAHLSGAERAQLRRSRIGMVFQTFGLIPTIDALENVALPLRLAGRPAGDAEARAIAALDEVELGGLGRHRIGELSGGERQRVGVARAIAIEPSLILADEPTGNLDQLTGRLILELLERQVRDCGATVVLVTHDPLSASVANRRFAMADGRLREQAS